MLYGTAEIDGQTLYRLADPSKLSRYSLLQLRKRQGTLTRQPVNLMRPHLRVRAVAVYAVAPMKPEEMLVDVLPVVTALEWMLTVLAEFSHFDSFLASGRVPRAGGGDSPTTPARAHSPAWEALAVDAEEAVDFMRFLFKFSARRSTGPDGRVEPWSHC